MDNLQADVNALGNHTYIKTLEFMMCKQLKYKKTKTQLKMAKGFEKSFLQKSTNGQ